MHYRALFTVVNAEDLFRRVAWKARGASYNKWRCASRIENGPNEGCDADSISETEIQNAVVRAINKTLGGREQFLVRLQHNIEDVLNGDSTATLEYIDQRMAELQEKLVMCVNKNAEYDVIANEIDALREKKAAVVTRDAEQEMLRKRIDEMRDTVTLEELKMIADVMGVTFEQSFIFPDGEQIKTSNE
ncbi:hypothetical protein JCM13267_11510 [Howardella ureilytica]